MEMESRPILVNYHKTYDQQLCSMVSRNLENTQQDGNLLSKHTKLKVSLCTINLVLVKKLVTLWMSSNIDPYLV